MYFVHETKRRTHAVMEEQTEPTTKAVHADPSMNLLGFPAAMRSSPSIAPQEGA